MSSAQHVSSPMKTKTKHLLKTKTKHYHLIWLKQIFYPRQFPRHFGYKCISKVFQADSAFADQRTKLSRCETYTL